MTDILTHAQTLYTRAWQRSDKRRRRGEVSTAHEDALRAAVLGAVQVKTMALRKALVDLVLVVERMDTERQPGGDPPSEADYQRVLAAARAAAGLPAKGC